MEEDKVKQEIVALAERIKDGKVSEEELVKFFDSHRIVFMNSDNVVFVPRGEKQTPPPGFRCFVSCSCGGRDDSCVEDGPGVFSWFFVNDEGNILRLKVQR